MRKWIPFIVLLSVAAIICGLHFYNNKEKITQKYKWRFEENINEPLERFAIKCLEELPTETAAQKAANLRHCINTHSAFSVDKDKYSSVWRDRAAMMRWLSDYAWNEKDTPPPMECFYRAKTLNRSLKILGYKSRTIVVTRDVDNFFDHVITETLNPDTKRWEIHDPTYDVKYFSKKDRGALGLKEIMTYDFDDFEPCDFKGKCGWDIVSREKFDVKLIKLYLSSAYVPEDDTLYLSRGFDENKVRNVYGEQKSFCQWKADHCRNIVRLGSLN